MGMGEAVRSVLRSYATFSGRAARPEYWWFVLALFLAQLIAAALDIAVFGIFFRVTAPDEALYAAEGPSVFGSLLTLAVFLPMLAVTWRRLHDTGRSGFWALLPMGGAMAAVVPFAAILAIGYGNPYNTHDEIFIPLTILMMALAVVPGLVLLWWLASRGDAGENRYGPVPAH